jgi:hypothetical protein
MEIYRISFEGDDKSYIGLSIKSGEKRLIDHYKSRSKTLISAAIRKNGDPIMEILKKTDDLEELYMFEQIYISQFNTLHPNGYNLTSGGVGVSGFKGSGRKKLADGLAKKHILFCVSPWVVPAIKSVPGTMSGKIEEALCEVMGWCEHEK